MWDSNRIKAIFAIIGVLLWLSSPAGARENEIEGLYNIPKTNKCIELRNDTFELFADYIHYQDYGPMGVLAIGNYKRINKNLLELNSANPHEWISKEISVSKSWDYAVPEDSIDVKIIINLWDLDSLELRLSWLSSNDSISKTIMITSDTTSVRIPRMTGWIDCYVSIADIMAWYYICHYTWRSEWNDFKYFPIIGYVDSKNICHITSEDNSIIINYNTIPYNIFSCLNVKGEYVLIKGNKLIWHGLTFRKVKFSPCKTSEEYKKRLLLENCL